MISLLKSIFSTTETRVLVVAAERATLYLFRDGEIAEAYIFNADEAGLGQFNRCLNELPVAPVRVLVDVVEEEYRQDTVPHVRASDRDAMIARKYARFFRGTTYHHALLQGRESEGRRDDRVLLTAIIKPDVLTPWIAALLEHKVPIAGVYSLPILSERLLNKLDAKGANVLLVSLQKVSGLRQTFFRDKQLKISRLAYMPRLGSIPYAAYLAGELEKLRRYLNSLALVSRNRPLDIYILSNGELLTELEQHCRDSEHEKFYLLDVADIAKRLGLKRSGDSHYSDELFAKLLTSQAPPNHYASPEETQFFTLHKARVGLAAAAVLLLLGSAAWSGILFVEGITFKQQALDALYKADFYQDRYEMARQKLPPTPVEPREIKTPVDVVESLKRYKSGPQQALIQISAALELTPQIALDGIRWEASIDGRSKDDGSSRQSGEDAARADGDALYSYYHVAEMAGHLQSFDGDFRTAIETIDRLALQLESQPDVVSVTVIEYPLDVRSEANLSGSTTAQVERSEAAFTIRVVIGAGDGQKQS